MSEIHIVACLDIKKEYLEATMPVLQELVEGSRKEPGNRYYDLTVDLNNPLSFTVIECWASAKAIEEHNASPHFQKFVHFIEGKSDALSIKQLRKVL